MQALTGDASIGVTIGLTLVMFGAAAWMLGQALALTWRPPWLIAPYVALLAAADRFASFALFEGELLAPVGYLIAVAVLAAFAAAAFLATRAAKMVQQYPWLFERSGPFAWRERAQTPPGSP